MDCCLKSRLVATSLMTSVLTLLPLQVTVSYVKSALFSQSVCLYSSKILKVISVQNVLISNQLKAVLNRCFSYGVLVARCCSGRVSNSQSADCGFDSRPRHCRATTLGMLFTPMCLCLPSSISWYLARAFMSTRRQPWHEVQRTRGVL